MQRLYLLWQNTHTQNFFVLCWRRCPRPNALSCTHTHTHHENTRVYEHTYAYNLALIFWTNTCIYLMYWHLRNHVDTTLIPKLLLRLLWFFRRSEALFRQIGTFPKLFRFCSDLGNPGIRQIVRNSMLTDRWWEGRILINLCGKNNVRNCDLLQSYFFCSL